MILLGELDLGQYLNNESEPTPGLGTSLASQKACKVSIKIENTHQDGPSSPHTSLGISDLDSKPCSSALQDSNPEDENQISTIKLSTLGPIRDVRDTRLKSEPKDTAFHERFRKPQVSGLFLKDLDRGDDSPFKTQSSKSETQLHFSVNPYFSVDALKPRTNLVVNFSTTARRPVLRSRLRKVEDTIASPSPK
jgi:hypothetical protein